MEYGAIYLMVTMDTLISLGGKDCLDKLRNKEDNLRVVQNKLQVFHGLGCKVADCVALFSLKQDNAILNLVRRDYDVNNLWKDTNSLTPTVYHQVGDMFRCTFSPKARWAHSLLFLEKLPIFVWFYWRILFGRWSR